jgi:hypothetical protein
MLADHTKAVSFTEFVAGFETKLRQSLAAAFGPELGKEATAEALAYGWEHWDRVAEQESRVATVVPELDDPMGL